MNTKICAWIGMLCLPLNASLASLPQSEINPALLYWQAFAVMPDLAADDQKLLFETQWRTRPMDERAGELTLRYDQAFELLRTAAASKTECDWGVDLSLGPQALLPHLPKVKRCATVALLRARWALQQNKQAQAAEDLVATFVMARNVSRDKTLIGALVQIAVERMVLGFVVQEWPALSADTVGSLLGGFDGAPTRGTIATCMVTERTGFYEWLLRNIDELQQAHGGNDEKVLQAVAKLIDNMASNPDGKPSELGGKVVQAAGGTVPGVVAYVRELKPLYLELERVMTVPYAEFEPAIEGFQQRLAANSNLLARDFIPAAAKARDKEFKVLAWLGMVHAAYQIRLDPAHGLQAVADPFGSGPFDYTRFDLDGSDRGFKLKSQVRNPDFPEVLIFAEKSGPPFLVDGPYAGQKVK